MATEFTVILENRPGTLARRGIVLGDAMVNIEAFTEMPVKRARSFSLCPMTRTRPPVL